MRERLWGLEVFLGSCLKIARPTGTFKDRLALLSVYHVMPF
uniref:Uncharacterized protein n=1 Tax=Anguilla anguilla TaxID=7936 RepID=A0A0E9RA10_ANGAN